jgi:hypothetical protein
MSAVQTLLLVGAVGGVMVPPALPMTTRRTSFVLENWRAQAKAWAKTDDEVTTKKWGLEVAIIKRGLDVHFFGGDKAQAMVTAGDLLKRYGPAYLLTSVSLATVSYAACYVAVARGVNVATLLTRVGMKATAANEKVGTASIAYVCHKAASPLRFAPTVGFTPVVARRLFGRRDV